MIPSENPPCTPAETETEVLQEISDASVNLSEDYASLVALLEELKLWIDYASERGVYMIFVQYCVIVDILLASQI